MRVANRFCKGGWPKSWPKSWQRALGCALAVVLTSCNAAVAPNFKTEAESTPAEDSIGERLFLDTRFSQ